MPKLFQINTFCNTRSTGRIAESLGKKVIEHGWDSYIAYGRDSCPSESEMIKVGSTWDIAWHGLKTRLFDMHGLASKRATRQLIDKMTEIEPDIIHLHNIHGYYLNYPILFNFLKNYGKPVIWTLHDCWSFTGHCPFFDFAKCDRWKSGCFSCPNKKGYPGSFLIDNSKSNYKRKHLFFTEVDNLTLVPVSDWLANNLQESFFKNVSIHRIHNGIDLNTFKFKNNSLETFRRYSISDDNRLVLGVANVWEKRKGLSDFFKLRELLPNNYTIVLVGLSNKQISSLPYGILGIQRTDSLDELVSLYSASDVFFNPTWEDNLPTVNIEAMACGTPVVAYRTGGCVEQIVEGTGNLVNQGDVFEASKIIRNMTILKDQYKVACRKHAETFFNQDDRYEEYYNLYLSFMS